MCFLTTSLTFAEPLVIVCETQSTGTIFDVSCDADGGEPPLVYTCDVDGTSIACTLLSIIRVVLIMDVLL